MKSSEEIDFIIVGQGLAGSAVAIRALDRKYRIAVLDEPSANRSSLIAAGLFNPITGRNMVKSWLADEIFPVLHEYYKAVERLTKRRFFYPLPLYRPFLNIEEQNEWMGKSADETFADYISSVSTAPCFPEKVNDPFGGITLKQTGYLDTRTYLEAVRQYVQETAVYQAGIFREDELVVGDNFVRYGNLTAKKIVFCQGVRNNLNPWFKYLPLTSQKGEFITVQSEWKKDVILNRGVYVVPGTGRGEYRVGATFNRNDHSHEITSWARSELTQKLEDLIRIPYAITGQLWGVRPTTPDRRPILGGHPTYKSLVIFNGLGTKGVSLAPYFSEVLIRWMENKGTIDKQADLGRFK